MPNSVALKFKYPPVRYHQDIRTVTISKVDPVESDADPELYRVCDPIITRRLGS